MIHRTITTTLKTETLATIITALENDIEMKEQLLSKYGSLLPKTRIHIEELKAAKIEIEKIFYG